jgi:hypothetical protein
VISGQTLLGGAVLYGAAAYAAQTIPTPSNPWAKWIVGIVQYVLSNSEKGKAALK